MALRPQQPKYAMVRWPDALDQTLPSCILLACVDDAVQKGAVVIAREDAELTHLDALLDDTDEDAA